jgi:hypothetical protein
MKYALITFALTASTLALPTKLHETATADTLKLDHDTVKLVDSIENRLESLTAGVAKREEASNDALKAIDAETVGPMLHEVESLLSSLTGGIAKREELSAGDLLNVKSMLSEVESLLGGLTGSIAKRQESSNITKNTELATSMLTEVETLVSSLTHGIAKRQATISDEALDISPAKIDALIDSLHHLLSTLKDGVTKRQDTTDFTTLVERLEALLELLKAAGSTL